MRPVLDRISLDTECLERAVAAWAEVETTHGVALPGVIAGGSPTASAARDTVSSCPARPVSPLFGDALVQLPRLPIVERFLQSVPGAAATARGVRLRAATLAGEVEIKLCGSLLHVPEHEARPRHEIGKMEHALVIL